MNNPKLQTYLSEAPKLLRGNLGNHTNEVVGKTLLIKVLLSGSEQFNLMTAEGWQSLMVSSQETVSPAIWHLINEGGYYKSLPADTLVNLVEFADKHGITGLTGEDFSTIISMMAEPFSRLLNYDKSFYPLIIQSAGLKEETIIYSNSLLSLPILGYAVDVCDVSIELLERLAIVYAFEELFPDKVNVNFTDIYTQADKNSNERFDVGIVFPPLGQRIQADEMKIILENDKTQRFSIPSRSTEVLSIQHSFSEVDGRLVVLVAQGVLFNNMEKPFRKSVVDNGKLKSIIFFPAGSLNGASIATAMLVFDTQAYIDHDSVRFVDLDKAGHIHRHRRIAELVDIDSLLKKINSQEDFAGIVSVSREQIRDQDYVLTAQRYPMTEDEKQFAKVMGKIPTSELVEIVSFERSVPAFSRNEDSTISVWEVTSSDIEEGYLITPSREVKVSKRAIDEYDKSFLQPKDIIISTKGSSAGSVALVPDSVPSPGENGWVANQFSLVLRVKKTAKISAEALFVYLRSPLGQKLLARLNEGTAMATLSLANLKTLPVLEITEEQDRQAQEIVAQDKAMLEQITQLHLEKQQRYHSLWNWDN